MTSILKTVTLAEIARDKVVRIVSCYNAPVISKYFTTLFIAVVLVTLACSLLPFVTRAQILSGSAVDQTSQFEFIIDAGSGSTYRVSSRTKRFLESHVQFCTDGVVRVVSSKVEITPKKVSWIENRTTIRATGAAMIAQIKWDTPADSANGAQGDVYINFPAIPWLDGHVPTFSTGAYQVDRKGRYVIREVTTYRNAFLLALARFELAFAAGLSFGILFHTVYWVLVLIGKGRSRLGEVSAHGSGLPRTFCPSPMAAFPPLTGWFVPLLIVGTGALTGCVMTGFPAYQGFVSSTFRTGAYIMLAIFGGVALLVGYLTTKSFVTVRVDAIGISYSRGLSDSRRLSAAWEDIRLFTQKSRIYRGTSIYWIEIEFKDGRRKLKISQSIEGYPALRDILQRMLHSSKPS